KERQETLLSQVLINFQDWPRTRWLNCRRCLQIRARKRPRAILRLACCQALRHRLSNSPNTLREARRPPSRCGILLACKAQHLVFDGGYRPGYLDGHAPTMGVNSMVR